MSGEIPFNPIDNPRPNDIDPSYMMDGSDLPNPDDPDSRVKNQNAFSYSSLNEVLAANSPSGEDWAETFSSEGENFLKADSREWYYKNPKGEASSLTATLKGSEEESRHVQIVSELFSQGWSTVEYLDKFSGNMVREVYFADEKGRISFKAYEFKAKAVDIDPVKDLVDEIMDDMDDGDEEVETLKNKGLDLVIDLTPSLALGSNVKKAEAKDAVWDSLFSSNSDVKEVTSVFDIFGSQKENGALKEEEKTEEPKAVTEMNFLELFASDPKMNIENTKENEASGLSASESGISLVNEREELVVVAVNKDAENLKAEVAKKTNNFKIINSKGAVSKKQNIKAPKSVGVKTLESVKAPEQAITLRNEDVNIKPTEIKLVQTEIKTPALETKGLGNKPAEKYKTPSVVLRRKNVVSFKNTRQVKEGEEKQVVEKPVAPKAEVKEIVSGQKGEQDFIQIVTAKKQQVESLVISMATQTNKKELGVQKEQIREIDNVNFVKQENSQTEKVQVLDEEKNDTEIITLKNSAGIEERGRKDISQSEQIKTASSLEEEKVEIADKTRANVNEREKFAAEKNTENTNEAFATQNNNEPPTLEISKENLVSVQGLEPKELEEEMALLEARNEEAVEEGVEIKSLEVASEKSNVLEVNKISEISKESLVKALAPQETRRVLPAKELVISKVVEKPNTEVSKFRTSVKVNESARREIIAISALRTKPENNVSLKREVNVRVLDRRINAVKALEPVKKVSVMEARQESVGQAEVAPFREEFDAIKSLKNQEVNKVQSSTFRQVKRIKPALEFKTPSVQKVSAPRILFSERMKVKNNSFEIRAKPRLPVLVRKANGNSIRLKNIYEGLRRARLAGYTAGNVQDVIETNLVNSSYLVSLAA